MTVLRAARDIRNRKDDWECGWYGLCCLSGFCCKHEFT